MSAGHLRATRWIGRFMVALAAVAACMGLFFAVMGVLEWRRAAGSTGWPTVEGTVVESRRAATGRRGGAPAPVVRYEYEAGGSRHVGARLDFRMHWWSPEAIQAVLDANPVNARVTVHHDPDDPSVACLSPGSDAWNAAPIAMGAFAMGFCAVFVTLVRRAVRIAERIAG
jgi:hypothetical protein